MQVCRYLSMHEYGMIIFFSYFFWEMNKPWKKQIKYNYSTYLDLSLCNKIIYRIFIFVNFEPKYVSVNICNLNLNLFQFADVGNLK